MAALFTDLHDVAQVLAEHIREEVGIVDVQPGVPRDVAATTEAAARITLLYTTPQPAHRNDPPERQPDGTTASRRWRCRASTSSPRRAPTPTTRSRPTTRSAGS